MTVRVERQPDRTMTKHVLDDFRMDALQEKQRCRRVPEVMEADARNTCGIQRRIERLPRPRRVNRSTDWPSEDEIEVAPFRADMLPAKRLPVAMHAQGVDCTLTQEDRAARARGFGRH